MDVVRFWGVLSPTRPSVSRRLLRLGLLALCLVRIPFGFQFERLSAMVTSLEPCTVVAVPEVERNDENVCDHGCASRLRHVWW